MRSSTASGEAANPHPGTRAFPSPNEVLRPDDLAGGRVQAVQVSDGSEGIDPVADNSGGGPGPVAVGEIVVAHGINVRPERFAGCCIETEDALDFLRLFLIIHRENRGRQRRRPPRSRRRSAAASAAAAHPRARPPTARARGRCRRHAGRAARPVFGDRRGLNSGGGGENGRRGDARDSFRLRCCCSCRGVYPRS